MADHGCALQQCDAMLSLKNVCVSPVSNEGYIRSAQGGTVRKPDWQKVSTHMYTDMHRHIHTTTDTHIYVYAYIDRRLTRPQDKVSHAFLLQFDSEEDRLYYARQDPAHAVVRDGILPHLVEAQIFNFSPGVFRAPE